MLVLYLLQHHPDLWDEVQGWHDDADGYRPEIFQWLAFPGFADWHYQSLIDASVPVLDTEFGTWVGITSWGSPYELYVYPQLIRAVYGLPCRCEDLDGLR